MNKYQTGTVLVLCGFILLFVMLFISFIHVFLTLFSLILLNFGLRMIGHKSIFTIIADFIQKKLY